MDLIDPIQADDYRTCAECLHAYRSEAELLAACAEIGHPVKSGDEAYACPLCAHDF